MFSKSVLIDINCFIYKSTLSYPKGNLVGHNLQHLLLTKYLQQPSSKQLFSTVDHCVLILVLNQHISCG